MDNPSRLLVIAGPSCVGKSHLLKALQEDEFPLICDKIGWGQFSSWEFCSAYMLLTPIDLAAQNTVFHYDFQRPFFTGFGSYQNDPVLRIFDHMQEIVVLTMWEAPDLLWQRYNQRIQQRLLRLFARGRFLSILNRLPLMIKKRWSYRQPLKLWGHYKEWFEFCAEVDPVAHWLFRGSTSNHLSKLTDWPDSQPFWASPFTPPVSPVQ